MKTRQCLPALGIALLATLAFAETEATPTLKQIMQGLRDDTVSITDGLLTDDFELIAKGAASIADHARISDAEIQRVALELGSEMAAFKQFDTSVHDLALSIASATEERDRERAAADFQRMLGGCLGCHAAYKERVAAALSAPAGSD